MDASISNKLKEFYIREAISGWAGEEGYELIDDVQNIIYKIKIDDKPHILRFSHSSVRTNDDILSEIFMRFALRKTQSSSHLRALLFRHLTFVPSSY